ATLTWNAASGAVSYNVKRSTTSGGTYTTISTAGAVTTTSYPDTGLTNGTTYYYVVSAVNGAGESANSTEASATPQPPAPAAPTGLTATPGDHQVALSWGASSGATGYNVYRSATSGSYTTPLNGSPILGTSYTDSSALNGSTYFYVVRAVNGGGSSGNSNQVSATPQPPIPAPPTGLTATPGNNQVALSWSGSGGATSYNVKRSATSGSGYATISGPSGTLTTTSFNDPGAVNGATYYYVVTAQNGGGESGNSAEVSITLAPSAPGPLVATAGDGQVALSWGASSGATSYNVKRSTTSGGPYALVTSVSGT